MGWSSKKAGGVNMGNNIPEMVMTGCDWEKEYEQDGEAWNLLVNSIFQKKLNATCFFDAAGCVICSEFVMILVDFRLLGRNIILVWQHPSMHYVAFTDAMNICRYPQIHTSSYIHVFVWKWATVPQNSTSNVFHIKWFCYVGSILVGYTIFAIPKSEIHRNP